MLNLQHYHYRDKNSSNDNQHLHCYETTYHLDDSQTTDDLLAYSASFYSDSL